MVGPTSRSSSVRPGLREFFFLRHGARLDQLDPRWRETSPMPYDTPITKAGVDQARLTGQSIAQHGAYSPPAEKQTRGRGTGKRRRYVIHTSPFLRCIQTSLALASMLDADAHTTLRLDCFLGEWMTTDYYTDIQAPPPMAELVSHALYYLRQLSRSPPSSMSEASLTKHFQSLRLATDGKFDATASATQEAIVELNGVQVDWHWDSSRFGDGGEYGEEWPEMHKRFRHSLRRLIDHYSDPQSPDLEEDAIVIMVTHGAGCNAMIGAVSGKPVLTDVGIASLSHAILRPALSSTPDCDPSRKRKISEDYCLLMSASVEHLSLPVTSDSAHHSRGSSQSSTTGIGRSGSWHNNLGRAASLHDKKPGLWQSRHPSRHVSVSSVEMVPSSLALNVADTDSTKLDPRAVTRQRGRQRSFTVAGGESYPSS